MGDKVISESSYEVIATRDNDGDLSIWPPQIMVIKNIWGNWDSIEGSPFVEDSEFIDARDALGGTYCGIRKGGKKRIQITKTLMEIDWP